MVRSGAGDQPFPGSGWAKPAPCPPEVPRLLAQGSLEPAAGISEVFLPHLWLTELYSTKYGQQESPARKENPAATWSLKCAHFRLSSGITADFFGERSVTSALRPLPCLSRLIDAVCAPYRRKKLSMCSKKPARPCSEGSAKPREL